VKEEAQGHTLWSSLFGRSYGPVVRQNMASLKQHYPFVLIWRPTGN